VIADFRLLISSPASTTNPPRRGAELTLQSVQKKKGGLNEPAL
jgi:hypothetical protein